MIEPIELSNGVITLKPYGPQYLDQLYDSIIESMTELSAWMSWAHPAYSKDETREWLKGKPREWEMGISYEFAILDASDGSFLGGCGLNHIHVEDNFANLGYWIMTGRTGQGVATAAARLTAGFGFGRVKLTRAEIVVAVGNKASLRVAAKAGATREAQLRNRIKVGETIHDGVMFSLIPEDFAP
ncbi:MAG: GNAT family N-acetyltransferase [Deltaproteobacteria bacterium]|nr:GNAT family N-acetyltransferase [Deltaproteobacteria bacterium]